MPSQAADQTRDDLRTAAVLTLVLAVIGAALGPAWSAWSGPQQRAFVFGPGQVAPATRRSTAGETAMVRVPRSRAISRRSSRLSRASRAAVVGSMSNR